ncbi:Hypp2276 [Branchiostoma lanceolatum]|uniref:Hypp2276 protein n=1 Tax=Branchiostoma lanceolatum TaxID=7740 RepID=A0A8J9ZPQ6_BRALA|nr:Hypp2276 [Branchiostoma lanceolatum]
MRAPLVPTPQEEQQKRCEDYRSLLTIDGKKLPDPLVDLKSGWKKRGRRDAALASNHVCGYGGIPGSKWGG